MPAKIRATLPFGNFGSMAPSTLVLIHGFPLDGGLWQPQVALLAGHRRVLAPDLRGFGQDRRPLPRAMTMEAYADDLRELLDAQGIARAVLCGLSMGGYVAMAFAELWPERVLGLVLCNTRASADTDEGRAAREQTASDALAKGAAVIARAMVPKVLSEQSRRTQPGTSARLEAIMARQSPQTIAAASRGMALRPDRLHVLSGLGKPALIITGSNDSLMPLCTSEAMHAAMPGSRMVILDGAAHITNLEAPDAFNAAIEQFLDELDHSSSSQSR